MVKWASPHSFFSISLKEGPNLDKLDESRIEDLVSLDRGILLKSLVKTPIRAQEYKNYLIVIRGHHRVYAANERGIEMVPYEAVEEFEESDLVDDYITSIPNMILVSHEDYEKMANGRPWDEDYQ